MDKDGQDRRDIVNRLKEHLNGPLSDDTRAEVVAALEREKERTRPRPWHRSLMERLRAIK